MRREKTTARPINPQKITSTGSEVSFSALSSTCDIIRVYGDALFHIEIGGTATTNSLPCPAGSPQDFSCNGGEIISVISNSGTANIWLAEMTQ